MGSPTPTSSSTRKQDGTIVGRNRAASTAKSVLSSMSTKSGSNLQLVGSKKINTAPRMYSTLSVIASQVTRSLVIFLLSCLLASYLCLGYVLDVATLPGNNAGSLSQIHILRNMESQHPSATQPSDTLLSCCDILYILYIILAVYTHMPGYRDSLPAR